MAEKHSKNREREQEKKNNFDGIFKLKKETRKKKA